MLQPSPTLKKTSCSYVRPSPYPIGKRRGLTLIELLSVIAIIGVLTAILVPASGYAIERARKVKAANNLRQIAAAYIAYTTDEGGLSRTINKDNIYAFAQELAKNVGLNDAHIWMLPDDPKIEAKPTNERPKQVIKQDQTLADHFDQFPLSFAVASKVSSQAPPSTTPIAWTRGLKNDGTWDAVNGVYGNKGGFIAFLDGHVEWFSNLNSENRLIKYTNGGTTNNIEEALNNEAKICEPTV